MNKPILLLVAIAVSIIVLSVLFPSGSNIQNAPENKKTVENKAQTSNIPVENYRIVNTNKIERLGTAIAWSPDKKYIYYTIPSENGRQELYARDMDGNKKRIGENVKLYSINDAKWSPDGTMLSFISTYKDKSKLYIYDTSNGKLKDITPSKISDVGVISYDWDEESLNIIMAVDIANPKIELYSIRSGKAGRIDIDVENCTDVAFYRDGKIIYSDRQNGKYKIFVADLSGKNIETISDGRNFAISHDRYRLAVLSNGDGEEGLWILNMITKDKRKYSYVPVRQVYWTLTDTLMYSTEEDYMSKTPYGGSIYIVKDDGRALGISGAIYSIFTPSLDGMEIAMTSPEFIEGEDKGIFIGKVYR